MTDTPVLPGAPPAPSTPAEANTVLQSRLADKAWGAKLLANDVEVTREYRALREKADNPDPADTVAAAMSGNVGEIPDSEVALMANTAGMLREIGVRESIIEETLRGHVVTEQEFKLVEAWKARQMRDPVFVKAFLSGGAEERQKMTLAAIVLSGGIKDARGRF
jgi:hypothetical protein